jgi:hypothetical protein
MAGACRESGNWRARFTGQRPRFPPGHDVTLKHGAYATVALAPRGADICEELTGLVPASSPIDGPVIRALALTPARIGDGPRRFHPERGDGVGFQR